MECCEFVLSREESETDQRRNHHRQGRGVVDQERSEVVKVRHEPPDAVAGEHAV